MKMSYNITQHSLLPPNMMLSLFTYLFLQSCIRETGAELWPLCSFLKVMNLHFTFKCQIHL